MVVVSVADGDLTMGGIGVHAEEVGVVDVLARRK